MQLTVREICDMITNGQLHYNQSTQRQFIYADMAAQLDCGETTKAGSLLNAILEHNIQLPAVYFWHNTDTGNTNIHDGKQRLLSIYYFINPTNQMHITTLRNGRETIYAALSDTDKEYLLNYTFDVVERTGTSEEEELSFDLINSNSVALTQYECLSGMLHGTFLDEFETYIDTMSRTLDKVKKVGRGEQAYKLLLMCFNLCDDKQTLANSRTALRLRDAIRPVRGNSFNADAYSFGAKLIAFNELMRAIPGIKDERAISIANYLVTTNKDVDEIVLYYRQCLRLQNDITSWDVATHKTFIDAHINGLNLDPQRMFTKDIKDILYARSNQCAHIDEEGHRCTETSYSKLEIDHITPWSQGGRTIIDNAQLLCKHHNTSKGNRE